MSGWFSPYESVNKVVMIPIDLIEPNPMQPRKFFPEAEIRELAASISANGLLQPIILRKLPGGRFELVAGHRRMLACTALGKRSIPAIIETMDDKTSAILAIVENLQRQDLSYFEEAEGIAALLELYDMNQQQVAVKLGKAQSTIANKLRLLKLPLAIRQRIREAGLTERHSRALVRLTGSDKLPGALEHIIKNNLNVEATEAYIDRLLEQTDKQHPTRLFIIKDIRLFLNTVNKAIDTMVQAGIPVDSVKSEDDDTISYTIKIPKSAAYRKGATHSA